MCDVASVKRPGLCSVHFDFECVRFQPPRFDPVFNPFDDWRRALYCVYGFIGSYVWPEPFSQQIDGGAVKQLHII